MSEELQRRNRELAWDELGKKYPVDPTFRWITHTCDLMHPSEMATSHLFNALKMIWNHCVPEDLIIHPYRRWGGIPLMPKFYRRNAVRNLFNELMNRPDRTEGMNSALKTMAQHVDRVLSSKKLVD